MKVVLLAGRAVHDQRIDRDGAGLPGIVHGANVDRQSARAIGPAVVIPNDSDVIRNSRRQGDRGVDFRRAVLANAQLDEMLARRGSTNKNRLVITTRGLNSLHVVNGIGEHPGDSKGVVPNRGCVLKNELVCEVTVEVRGSEVFIDVRLLHAAGKGRPGDRIRGDGNIVAAINFGIGCEIFERHLATGKV